MTDVPRRPPPTSGDRLRVIAARTAGGSMMGGTRMGQRPGAPARGTLHGPPGGGSTGDVLTKQSGEDHDYDWAAGGGGGSGPLAQACYLDANSYSSAGAAAFGGTGPETVGSYATYFSIGSGGAYINIIAAGWYGYSAWAQVVGCTTGCFVSANDGFTQPGLGYAVGGFGVDSFPTVVKVPFYVDAGSLPLPVSVTFGGGGTTFKNIVLDLIAYG